MAPLEGNVGSGPAYLEVKAVLVVIPPGVEAFLERAYARLRVAIGFHISGKDTDAARAVLRLCQKRIDRSAAHHGNELAALHDPTQFGDQETQCFMGTW